MTQEKVDISILMPVYNVAKYLRTSVESILDSDFSNFEILILDDCSKDKTLQVAKALEKEDSRIRVFKNKTNLGVGKSLNELLEEINGKYFTRLDGDDTIHPKRLSKQFSVMEKGEYGCCGTNLSFMDEKGAIFDENRYTCYKAPARFTAAFINPIPNATLMYRTDIVRRHNLWFPELKVAEDYSFLLSYLKYSDAFMINEPLYHYRMLDDSLSHIHSDLSIDKGGEFCKEYMETISPGFSNTEIYNFLTAFNTKPEYSNTISDTIIEETKKVIANFKKHYSFSDEEEKECILFMEKLVLDRTLFYKDYYDSLNIKLILPRRILRYYRLNGPSKTIKKIWSSLLHPKKRAKK